MDYFTYPGVPGRYFACAAHKATISESRCAAMYRDAKHLKPGSCMPLERCIGCSAGAAHAGDSAPQSKARVVGALTCARCHQQAARLVCGGICVSCKNREWEVAKGRNAKGLPPHPIDRFWNDEAPDTKVLVMHRVVMSVSIDGKEKQAVMPAVADTLEALLRISKTTNGVAMFGMRSPLVDSMKAYSRWMDCVTADRPRPAKRMMVSLQMRLFD